VRDEGIALVEAATSGQLPGEEDVDDDRGLFDPVAALEAIAPEARPDTVEGQAAQQSDEVFDRKRDPEY
jgi:hypothetical protein